MSKDTPVRLPSSHLVLKHKKTGKVASRSDQLTEAMSLEAMSLDRTGKGGGIVELLLPETEYETLRLDSISKKYAPARVVARDGSAAKRMGKSTVKSEIADALNNDELFLQLAVAYCSQLDSEDRSHIAPARAIAIWLKSELDKKNSPLYRFIKRRADILLEAPRSNRWWEDAISRRHKTQS